jgi:hypothetical protein
VPADRVPAVSSMVCEPAVPTGTVKVTVPATLPDASVMVTPLRVRPAPS